MLVGVYNKNYEFKLAESLYSEAIQDFIFLSDTVRLVACYINFGEHYRKLGKLDLALSQNSYVLSEKIIDEIRKSE